MTFWQRLIDTLQKLLSSGKVLTAMAGFICYIAAKKNIVLSQDDVQGILILFGTLIGAMGLNDIGKGKALVEAANPKPPETVQQQTVNVQPDSPPVVNTIRR